MLGECYCRPWVDLLRAACGRRGVVRLFDWLSDSCAAQDGQILASSQHAPSSEKMQQANEVQSPSSTIGSATPKTLSASGTSGALVKDGRAYGPEYGSGSQSVGPEQGAVGGGVVPSGGFRDDGSSDMTSLDGRRQGLPTSPNVMQRRAASVGTGEARRASPEEKEALVLLKG